MQCVVSIFGLNQIHKKKLIKKKIVKTVKWGFNARDKD